MTGLRFPRRLRALASMVVMCLMLGWLAPPAAGQAGIDEYQVKAAFVFNFAKFVQWPYPADTLVIGVLGDATMEQWLSQLVKGRTVGGRPITIKPIAAGGDVDGVHVLFVSASEARGTAALLSRLAGQPVLTVGETAPFGREGGIVRFFEEGNRIRFAINVAAAERAGLKIPAQLLTLAAR